ncbi:peptidylprolyl isomerase SurA, partial [Plesiomonas shigelloides]|nr:peptidylprolyl isomerase SurA [Plesiomonas shigelloides]
NYADYREQIRIEMLATAAPNSQLRNLINILPHEVDTLAPQTTPPAQKGDEITLSPIQLALPENPPQAAVDAARQRAEQPAPLLKQVAYTHIPATANTSGPRPPVGGN